LRSFARGHDPCTTPPCIGGHFGPAILAATRACAGGEEGSEIGQFAPDNRRTRTILCATDWTLYSLSGEAMTKLHHQNPQLCFHVM
jgi:hypothetical protein